MEIFINTVQDAAPLMIGLAATWVVLRLTLFVLTAGEHEYKKARAREYSIAINSHKTRLSALE